MTAPPPFPRRASAQQGPQGGQLGLAADERRPDLAGAGRRCTDHQIEPNRPLHAFHFGRSELGDVHLLAQQTDHLVRDENLPGPGGTLHREAMLGASPNSARSRRSSSWGFTMTVRPAWMPTRTAMGIGRCDELRLLIRSTARQMSSPVCTRPVGIVFVGNRVTELGQNPVTGIVGNTASIGQHDPTADLLVLEKQVGIVLGVDHLAQLGRADQITEEERRGVGAPPRGALTGSSATSEHSRFHGAGASPAPPRSTSCSTTCAT